MQKTNVNPDENCEEVDGQVPFRYTHIYGRTDSKGLSEVRETVKEL